MRNMIDVTLSNECRKAICFSPDARRFVVADDGITTFAPHPFAVGVNNGTGDEPAEIALYGAIGDPYEQADSSSVGRFLRANKGRPVNVRINSMGGLAYDGIAIHNALASHDGKVTTIIEGMAGSAASVIAVAGHTVKIFENAEFFIHCAAMLAMGRATIMDEAGMILRRVDAAIARTYKAKTGKALEKLIEMMHGINDGTGFSAKEAIDARFADEIITIRQSKSNASNCNDAVVTESPRFVEADKERRLRLGRQQLMTSFSPRE